MLRLKGCHHLDRCIKLPFGPGGLTEKWQACGFLFQRGQEVCQVCCHSQHWPQEARPQSSPSHSPDTLEWSDSRWVQAGTTTKHSQEAKELSHKTCWRPPFIASF